MAASLAHGRPRPAVVAAVTSASSAAQLHREGVTEVVGYYGPIADELSTRSEKTVYAAVATGESTRLAVAQARAALQGPFDGDGTHRPAARMAPPSSAMSPEGGGNGFKV
ncbi:MAG: hypothetical protein ABJA98_17310 [Acidobacteriota bacterium]